MQIVAVPLYNKDMEVTAYMLRDFKENVLFSTSQAINVFDGASQSESMEILNNMGLDAFTMGKQIFIPIREILLMGNLQLQCKIPPEKVIFVIEEPISNEQLYLPLIQSLCEKGFRFSANYQIDCGKHDNFLNLCSFMFLSQRPERVEATNRLLIYIKSHYRNLKLIAAHIYTHEVLQSLYGKGYEMYESRFYRVTKPSTQLAPLKVNALRLINIVQDENFEFDDMTDIVKSDPALTISLLKLVNSTVSFPKNEVNSISHAVAALGQKEIRKWVTTAVSRNLGKDRPDEITRTSLIRARFCENLAPLFEMAHMSSELFLLGLFSVLDIILELPMADALGQVSVSDNIRKALTDESGILYPVINFAREYEIAYWSSISRQMIIHNISDKDLSDAYLNTLQWYKNLISLEE